jgi:benzoate transport
MEQKQQETHFDLHQLIDEAPVGSTQVLVLLVCFGLNIIDGYDVLAMAFAAPALADDWQLRSDQLGLVFSAGVLGMTLGAMFLAPLTDRIGRRSMVLGAVLVMGVSMLATAWMTSLGPMVLMRIITGLTIGAMLASLTSQVSEFFPDQLRNLAVGIMLAGYPLGATLGGFLAGALIPDSGWQGVFTAGGVMTLAMLPLIYWLLPESPHFLVQRRPAKALVKLNRVLLRLDLPVMPGLPQVEAEPEAPSVRSLLVHQRRKATLQLWSTFFLCFGTLYFLLSWIPKLLVDSGLPLEQAIYAGIAFNLGGVVGNIAVAGAAGKFGLQRGVLYFNFSAALGMLVFALVPLELGYMLALTALIGLFQQGGFVGFYMVAARMYPAEIRTTGVGWGIGLGRFGAVIAPYLAGLLIAVGWGMDSLFVLFSVPLVAGGMIIFSIRAQGLTVEGEQTS